MNKTLNINLGGLIFHIDEEAFLKLERYLTTLKQQFASTQGGAEIIKDIEVRIAELFRERTSEAKEVITIKDVDEVITILGRPEDYLDPEDEMGGSRRYSQSRRANKRVFRDPDDKILGGVASGLAAYINVDTIWVRIFFIVLAFSGFSILFYVILWAVIPKATTTAEKLQMRGESVNISNIERSVKEEFKDLGENVKDFGRKAGEYDYKKPANQFGEFIADVANFFLNALKFFVKFFFKLIGLSFLAMGFVALLALIAALFSGSFNIVQGGYNLVDLYDFLNLVTANTAHFNLMVIGVSLLILAPVTMIIYLGVRLIFKLDRLGRPARSGLTGVAILGFILVLISAIRIGIEFDDRSNYTRYNKLSTEADKLYLRVNTDEIYDELRDHDFNLNWLQTDEGNIFTQVQLDIRKANDGVLKVKRNVRAKGNTRRAARNNAENVNYQYSLSNDSVLSFNSYYLLDHGQRFRDQNVSLTLYLPVGTTVYLDDNMVDIIYDIDNLNDYWDFDMVNHEWIMTERGLRCTDCPKSDSYFEEEEADYDETYLEEDEMERELETEREVNEAELEREIEDAIEDEAENERLTELESSEEKSSTREDEFYIIGRPKPNYTGV